jgi:hypothetical protein
MAHIHPIGLVRHRATHAITSIEAVVLDQSPDASDRRLQTASERIAAITRPQVISQLLGLTTDPIKTAIGVETRSRRVPHR